MKMTKVAVWCRHIGDNIIGIGDSIPWHVPSDLKKFGRIVSGKNIVVGRKTYETLPPKFDKERIFILSNRSDFESRNPQLHQVVNQIKEFKEMSEDLYICGGAGIYNLFFTSGSKMMPDVVVDCVYSGDMQKLDGEKIDISSCLSIMQKKYIQIGTAHEEDDVTTAVYIKRGDFVEQQVLRHIINNIINFKEDFL